MKILYLSYDGMTDPLGQSQVLPYLLELSKLGHQITLLSTEKDHNFQLRSATIRDLLKQHRLQNPDAVLDWQYITYTKKPPVFSTLKDVRVLRKKALQLHRTHQFDVVHCRSYVTALVGLHMKKKLGVRFIFDMRGFWANERVDGGLWNLKNPVFRTVYNYFKKKERQFLKAADYTISLTKNAKDEIQNWPGYRATPIEVIPCCVDTELFDYQKVNRFLISEHPLTISYLGSIGTWYMLAEMLRFFKRLLLFYPNAQFLFITTEPPQLIYQEAQKLQIPKEQIRVEKAERKEVPEKLAQSDVSVFFIKPLYSKKASSATKMGEILAMGIPVITNNKVGDHQMLFDQYQFGSLIDKFDDATFDQVIDQLPMIRNIAKEKLRNAAIAYYSLKKGVDLYNEVYQKVLNQKSSNK